MEANGGALFRNGNSGSQRFLGLCSQPQHENPSGESAAAAAEDDDFDEDEVFWTGDFCESNRLSESLPRESHRNHRYHQRCFRQVQNFGILAALPEDENREELGERSLMYRKPSFPSSPSSSSTSSSSSRMFQAIPRPQVPHDREYSQSMPMNAPMRSRAGAAVSEVNGEDSDNEMLPPHEILAKRYRLSGIATFSVLEGAGRTLKGRDLRQVRNAVLQKTGFLD